MISCKPSLNHGLRSIFSHFYSRICNKCTYYIQQLGVHREKVNFA